MRKFHITTLIVKYVLQKDVQKTSRQKDNIFKHCFFSIFTFFEIHISSLCKLIRTRENAEYVSF